MAFFDKSIEHAKESLAEVSREAIDHAGERLAGVVKEGVSQAGTELKDVIWRASQEIDAKLDDGNLTTGYFQKISGSPTRVSYILEFNP